MNNLPAAPAKGDAQSYTQQDVQIEALRALQHEIPLNDFGLPEGIYRTDLLPFHDYKPDKARTNGRSHDLIVLDDDLGPLGESGDEPDGSRVPSPVTTSQVGPLTAPTPMQVEEYRIAGFPSAALSKAYVPLQYDEGFPAFLNGSPFWGRLEYEPVGAFQAFQRYLQMNLGRAADLEDEDDHGESASGTRSISQLAAIMHPDSDLLQMASTYQGYYHLYYWNSRAHAYDLFRVAQYRNQQDIRAIETQDEHYVEARRLRARLMHYFDDDPTFWELMTPKVAIDFLKTVTGLERISAGVPAAGPQTAEQADGAGTSFELHLKTVSQQNRGSQGAVIDEEGKVLDKALEDPETTEILQKIIIRTGG